MIRDEWRDASPVPIFLLLVGVVAFLVGACWLGVAT